MSQWRMSVVGRDCGLRQLVAFFTASGADLYWTAQLRVQRSCSVEQSAASIARKHVTGYI